MQTGAVYHRDNGAYRAQLLTYSLAFSELFGVKTFFVSFLLALASLDFKLSVSQSVISNDNQ